MAHRCWCRHPVGTDSRHRHPLHAREPKVGIGNRIWLPSLVNYVFRWLAAHDRMEEAQLSLARSRGIPKEEAKSHYIIIREVEEIKASVQYEKQIHGGWVDCFRPQNKTLYRTLLGMSLQSLQQLTGANYFFYYGATVFKAVGLSDSFVTQIILGAVNFVCTFGGMYVLERVSDPVRWEPRFSQRV